MHNKSGKVTVFFLLYPHLSFLFSLSSQCHKSGSPLRKHDKVYKRPRCGGVVTVCLTSAGAVSREIPAGSASGSNPHGHPGALTEPGVVAHFLSRRGSFGSLVSEMFEADDGATAARPKKTILFNIMFVRLLYFPSFFFFYLYNLDNFLIYLFLTYLFIFLQ